MNQPPSAPQPANRLPLWRVIGTLLSIALLAYLVYQQGWDEFSAALRDVPLRSFLLALGLVLISRLFVSARWYVLLRTAHMKVSFAQALRLTFTGLFASNFLPSTVGGDLARLAGAVSIGIDAGVTAASLLIDRLIGMAGMALLLPIGLNALVQAAVLNQPHNPNQIQAAGGLPAIPGWAWARKKLGGFLRSAAQSSVHWAKNPAGLGLAFLTTFGHMLFTYSAIWVLLSGAGQPVSLVLIGGLWSLSYFVSLAPFSINGLGLQEVSIAYLYTHFGGVSPQTGLALAVLLRILFLLASLPGALFLPAILSPTRRKTP